MNVDPETGEKYENGACGLEDRKINEGNIGTNKKKKANKFWRLRGLQETL